MKKIASLFFSAATLFAASNVGVTPMGLPCDGVSSFPCSATAEGGFIAQARSAAPVVMFELRYRDAEGHEHVARQAIVNENPGGILFAAFRVGMYRTNVSRGTEFVSLRVLELGVADETKVEKLGY